MAEILVPDNIFQHEPLDLTKPTIRVFDILPGTGTISCQIKQATVDSGYTAVSYVWGDPQPTSVILINEKPFQVRQNLHNFLVQMRKDNVLESLWVDAISIDQTNIAERNHQVQQMGSIYKKAHTVISWLGQGDDSVAQFMKEIVEVAKEVSEKSAARFGTSRSTISTNLYYLPVHRRRFQLADFWLLARSFCGIDYFERLWIVQEVFLATETHIARYGDIFIDWIDLKHSLSTYITMAGNKLSDLPAIPFFKPSVYSLDITCSGSILALIAIFSDKLCSDPRDHIFALRMLWDTCRFPIQVDYSLSGLALFIKLASLLLVPDVQPMSNAINLLNILQLGPDHFANKGNLYAEKSITIALSVAWSREINNRELSKYQAKRSEAGEYRPLGHRVAHNFRFCTCKHCIKLQLPETTIFREYVLRSQDHDPTNEEMQENFISCKSQDPRHTLVLLKVTYKIRIHLW